MSLKIMGCILITISSTSLGLNYIKKLKTRIYALNETLEFINIIKIKINYELCDIPDILHILGKKYIVAQQCYNHLKNGKTLQDAWYMATDIYSDKMYLKHEDRRILKDFCTCMGQTDVDGQISNLNMYANLIKEQLKNADSEFSKKSKVVFSTSMFTGLLISIILI